ncbi:MAG: hypothetical protein L0K65_08415 [Actinomyces sp.]|nr:hypothetical protein [Actinomyces sp.]
MANPAKGSTRLSNDVTKPQPTGAGDAPADTLDKKELATSATPDKSAAAAAGYQAVNAVKKAGTVPDTTPTGTRKETYTQFGADGKPIKVTHNYDTGTTEVDLGV